MSDVAELASGVRIADPKPGHCSGCLKAAGPDVRFVDYNAAINRGSFVDANGAMGVMDSVDWLYMCESCIRDGMEKLDLKPGLHRRQLNALREQNQELERLRNYVAALEAALAMRPEGRG